MSDSHRLDGKVVLQVIPELDAGGAERTTIEIAQAVVDAGGAALVASGGGRMEGELDRAGGVLIRRPSLKSKNPLTIRANAGWLAGVIREHGAHIIHARSRAPAWSALSAARRMQIPFVTTYHGAYNGRSPLKVWYNSIMARGDVVIANSAFIAEHVRTVHPFARDRIVTIPRGVDPTAYSPDAVSKTRISQLRDAWFEDKALEGRIMLLPGRLTAWKGQQAAISALAQLPAEVLRGWTLVLAGDAQGRFDYVSRLKAQISDAKLDERVRIVGHCDDMPAAYALSDVVIAPSQEPEAFGRVAAEAGALGKVAIVSDHGGQKEIVVDRITGFRVPPGDIAALSAAFARAMTLSDDDRNEMGSRAREHVMERFSTPALQAATLDAYSQLLERPR